MHEGERKRAHVGESVRARKRECSPVYKRGKTSKRVRERMREKARAQENAREAHTHRTRREKDRTKESKTERERERKCVCARAREHTRPLSYLHNIIAVLIKHKLAASRHNILQHSSNLRMGTVLEDALNDSASIRVHTQLHNLNCFFASTCCQGLQIHRRSRPFPSSF